MNSLVIGVIVVVGLVWAVASSIRYDRNKKREAQRFVENRPQLPHQEFGDAFFPNGIKNTAIKVREIMTKYVPVDVLKTLPSDRMNDDLHMDDLDSMAKAEFIIDLEKEFSIKISDQEAQRLLTIEDVIHCVAKKVNKE